MIEDFVYRLTPHLPINITFGEREDYFLVGYNGGVFIQKNNEHLIWRANLRFLLGKCDNVKIGDKAYLYAEATPVSWNPAFVNHTLYISNKEEEDSHFVGFINCEPYEYTFGKLHVNITPNRSKNYENQKNC